MDGRSTYLGKTFLFPQEQRQNVAQQRSGAGGGLAPDKFDEYFGIPKPAEDLQYTGDVRDKSRQYYQDLAALRQFAREQWTRYGNDVTAPDPSREDSIMAAQAFQAGIGNLMATADELKVSQKMLTPAFQAYTQNQYAFSPESFNQPFAQVAGTQAGGYSTQVDPLVKFYGEEVGRQFDDPRRYTQAQGQAQALQQQTAGLTGPMGERTKLAAQAIIPDIQRFAPKDTGGDTQSPVAGLVTEWAQLSAGQHPSFSITDRVGPQGSYLSESKNNAFVGKTFGKYQDPQKGIPRDFIIAKLEKDNDTNQVYAVNDQGVRKVLPKENIDVSIREALPSSSINEYEKYIAELSKQGSLPMVQGQGGLTTYNLPANLFVPQRDVQAAQASQQQAQAIQQQASQIKQQISTDLDKLNSGVWNRIVNFVNPSYRTEGTLPPAELEYDSDYGKVRVTKQGDGYVVKINNQTKKEDKKTKIFSKPQIEEYLNSLNVIGVKLRDSKGNEVPKGFDPTAY